MTRIERFFNNSNGLQPYPWVTGEVQVFNFEDGKPACFCMVKGSSQMRSSLPSEMFNHELMELDETSGEAIAYFLSKFGLFEDAKPAPFEVQDELALKLCVYASFGFCETPPHFPYKSIRGPRKANNAEAWMEDRLGLNVEDSHFELALANAHRDLDYKSVFPSFDELGLDESTLVQYEAVVRQIEFFRNCRSVYADLLACDDLDEIAEKNGLDPKGFIELAYNLDTKLNGYLRNYAPEISLVLNESVPVGELHGEKPNKFDPDYSHGLFSESRMFKPGSLSQALALQLLEFSISKSCWKICEKCGQVFVKRRTKKSKQNTRKNATTCCEDCRNALNQQKYRDSHKKMKQKNNETKSEES